MPGRRGLPLSARSLSPVAPGVWVSTAPRWRTTSTVVVGEDGGALVVDPALTPQEVTGLARAVVGRGWHVTAGFATHPHFDHLLWSPALGTAPRFATATCREVARREADALVQECAAEAPGHPPEVLTDLVALPTGGRTTLPWGGPTALVVEHQAHAPGHAALWLPGPAVLLVGDMLSDTEVPLLDTQAGDPVDDYQAALELLEPYVDLAHVVVPGHGRPADRAEARRRLAVDTRYLDDLSAGQVLSPVHDARLADPEVLAQHAAQTRGLQHTC